MIMLALPFLIGNVMFTWAKLYNVATFIYIGRILTGLKFRVPNVHTNSPRSGHKLAKSGHSVLGFAGGAFALGAPMYIMETAEIKMRGALASLMQLMSCLGNQEHICLFFW